ncbi:VOC family protein [Pseudonocardia endophytica]|uniref:Catechol 2,3-dioxygenase-like lactoylglutathione lyase family enzyme n=1 Tax=Pseudonocardia endophytica TaxID=401976 RepID=A0A4R1HXH4_PSEEN|nr:VOC family protein [Pseudonocardia endophytica]TCK27484.1 catechol 2,3-dioxygenase-like lactoylglutathione lyase family enzyme [Pseudonocardia endophytica]
MLDHVSITVDDLDAAVRFYDAVLGELGHERVSSTGSAAGYGPRNSPDDDTHCYLSIVLGSPAPDDRHWAFRAGARADVVRFHALAMVNGGSDDGGVDERPEYHPGYFSAFVRDPSGNRLEAVHHRLCSG